MTAPSPSVFAGMFRDCRGLVKRARQDPARARACLRSVRALRMAIHRLRAGIEPRKFAIVLDSGTPTTVVVVDYAEMSDGAVLATAYDHELGAEKAATVRAMGLPEAWALRWLVLRLERGKGRARIIRSRPQYSCGAAAKAFDLKEFVDEDRRREEDRFTYCQVRRDDGSWRVFTRTRIDFLPAERMLHGPATRASCLEWASGFDERAKAALEKDPS